MFYESQERPHLELLSSLFRDNKACCRVITGKSILLSRENKMPISQDDFGRFMKVNHDIHTLLCGASVGLSRQRSGHVHSL